MKYNLSLASKAKSDPSDKVTFPARVISPPLGVIDQSPDPRFTNASPSVLPSRNVMFPPPASRMILLAASIVTSVATIARSFAS